MPKTASAAALMASTVAPSGAANARLSALRDLGHDLRTPLSAILGFAELLAREQHGPLGSASYKEYAEIIQRSGADLLGQINALLARAAADISAEASAEAAVEA